MRPSSTGFFRTAKEAIFKRKALILRLILVIIVLTGSYLSMVDLYYIWRGGPQKEVVEPRTSVEVDGFNFHYRGFVYLWELPEEEVKKITSEQLIHSQNSFSFSHAFYPKEKVSTLGKTMHSSLLTIRPKNPVYNILCKLNLANNCRGYQVADVIDSFWHINPIYAGYQTTIKIRYRLHKEFGDNIKTIGMPFCTLEAIRDDRHQEYLMTQENNEPYDIRVKIFDDGYLRENLLNVAVKKIPQDWQYISWIDAHHIFENPYWWEEAIVKMEKAASVQLFQRFNGLTKTNHTQIDWLGALYKSFIQWDLDIGYLGFYGNAYGIRREVYDQMGYVFDKCIGGCCDCAYVKASLPPYYKFEYFRKWWRYTNQMDEWINATAKVFKASRAVVRGTAFHIPHEETFPYLTILGMFNKSDFDLKKHLVADTNGTLHLENDALKRKVEFWVFLYSFAVPLYVVGITVGVLVGVFCLFKAKKWWEARKRQGYIGVHRQE